MVLPREPDARESRDKPHIPVQPVPQSPWRRVLQTLGQYVPTQPQGFQVSRVLGGGLVAGMTGRSLGR